MLSACSDAEKDLASSSLSPPDVSPTLPENYPTDGKLAVLAAKDFSMVAFKGKNDNGNNPPGPKNNAPPSDPPSDDPPPVGGTSGGGSDGANGNDPEAILNFDSINITVREVSAHSVENGWQILSESETSFDLIQLSNDARVILSENRLDPANYTQIRLLVKDNATVTIEGEVTPIKIPSGIQTGIKIIGEFEVKVGFITSLVLDFDPQKSVVRRGNGELILKPTIKLFAVTEDLVPPQIAIVEPPDGLTNQSSQIVRVEYIDPNIDLDSLSVSIDGNNLVSQFVVSSTNAEAIINFAEGAHTIDARISDFGPNLAVADPINIVVDLTPPEIQILGIDNQFFNSLTISFLTQLADSLSGVDASSVEIRIDTIDVTNQFGVTEETITGDFTFSSSGAHSIDITASDKAGNQSSKSSTFTIDLVPPIITTDPGQNLTTNNSVLALTIFASDSSPINTKLFKDSVVIAESSQVSFSTTLNLVEGINEFNIVSIDAAGNSTSLLREIRFDSTPTVLSNLDPAPGATITTNVFSLLVSGESNEPLGNIFANGVPLNLDSTNTSFSGLIFLLGEGAQSIEFVTSDVSGNPSTFIVNFDFIVDQNSPVLSTTASGNFTTNNSSFLVPIVVQDTSDTSTRVLLNGNNIFTTQEKIFSVNVSLSEGANNIIVESTDSASNEANPIFVDQIILDTTPPSIVITSPSSGETIVSNEIFVEGTSNEILSVVTANGSGISLGSNGLSFSGQVPVLIEGEQTLVISATDSIGNTSETIISIEVILGVLNGSLISVSPAPTGNKLIIRGAPGATRSGLTVEASAGTFGLNFGSTVADGDGSFLIVMDIFEEATVTATDPTINRTDEVTVSFMLGTTFSGVVKSNDDVPLPGTIVSFENSNIQATTNASGTFSFSNPPLGDQVLVVDATNATIPNLPQDFSVVRVSINIGLNQSNVLPRPIFLAPLLMDGSQTDVVETNSVTVTNPTLAAGVEIEIPAGIAIFPDGSKSGSINIILGDSSRTTIPVLESMVPDKVICLEPSGLIFTEPVKVTLPNNNNLPAGIEVAILSMNSKKGIWEVDGIATVSSDGNSIVTKESSGITHFSEIYAVPLSPIFISVGEIGKTGTDIFNGSLITNIELPSFKSLGRDFRTSLTYNSSWAKPTAVVTNYIDLPRQVLSFTGDSEGSEEIIVRDGIEKKFCFTEADLALFEVFNVDLTEIDIDDNGCVVKYEDYIDTINWVSRSTTTSWYEPERIIGRFIISTLSTEQARLPENQEVSFTNPNSFEFQEGLIAEPLPVESFTYEGLPEQVVMTFVEELKDPDSGVFFETGVYPTISEFEIQLQELTIRTRNISLTSVTTGETQFSQESSIEQTILKQIIPQSLSRPIFVQNEIDSAAGHGWKINGIQKISNPGDNKIVVENGSGGLETYVIQNLIETVFDADATAVAARRVDLRFGVDLRQWPIATAEMIELDGSGASFAKINLDSSSGPAIEASFSFPVTPMNPDLDFVFRQPQLGDIIKVSDNTYFASDGANNGNGLIELRADSANLDFFAMKQFTNLADFPLGQGSITLNGCEQNSIVPCPGDPFPIVVRMPAYGGSQAGFNNPKGLTFAPDGDLVVADSGNNRVLKFSLPNNSIEDFSNLPFPLFKDSPNEIDNVK